MYEVSFKHMGFRIPFLDFHKVGFKWLELAPSQLHPNSMAFVQSFKLMCDYLELEPTIPFFFSVFTLPKEHTNMATRVGFP